jgi:hypothetical protein
MAMVSPETAELLRIGERFGIPKEVTDDQVADVGKITDAFNKGKRLFLLANEAGTGKTFVLGGAIREMRNAGANKFVYVTMNQDLIAQIKKDLQAYGVDDVQFDTYANVSTGKSKVDSTDAVLIFDETHNVGNINSARGNRGQTMMADARMTIMASATPFENPAQAEFLGGTGFFNDTFGGDFYQWVTAYGGTVTYFNDWPQVRWTGTKQDGKDARQYFFDQGIMTYRPMQIPADMVDNDFIRGPVDQKWADLFEQVDGIYASAMEGIEGSGDWGSIKMHRVNALKRILEASKVQAGIDRAKKHMADGKNPILFVETKSERHYGRFRKTGAKQSDPLYTPEQIDEMMREWVRLVDVAVQIGDSPPPPPFATFIWRISQAYAEKGVDFVLPSTNDDIMAGLGKKNIATYTGAVTNTRASKNLQDWRDGKKKVLVATMAKGGTGLSLHDTVGDHPTAQVNINLPWVAKSVDQVSGRSARYGLQSRALIEWLFASNIPFEEQLAARVGQRMHDMGAVVKGVDVKAAQTLTEDFDFEGTVSTQEEVAAQREVNIEDLTPLGEKAPETPPEGPPGGVPRETLDLDQETAGFDSEQWNREREERIEASKASGAKHLDDFPQYVESLRGKAFHYAHDPKERGEVLSVSNEGDIVVLWADDYSAEKNLATGRDYTYRGKVIGQESWLSPSDAKDYVVDNPDYDYSADTNYRPGKNMRAQSSPAEPEAAPEPQSELQALNESVKALTAAMQAQPAEEAPAEPEEARPLVEPDQKPLFSKMVDQKTLSVSHNLTSENLVHAERLGGLAVPSLAVMPEDAALRNYGDITLIGTRDLGDPAQVPVYDADAYTSTFPRAEYKKVRMAPAQALVDRIRPWATKYRTLDDGRPGTEYVLDATWDYSVNNPDPEKIIREWMTSNGIKAMYLKETTGVDTRPVYRDARPRDSLSFSQPVRDFFAKADPSLQNRGWDDPERQQQLVDGGDAVREGLRLFLRDLYLQVEGNEDLSPAELDALIESDPLMERRGSQYFDEKTGALSFGTFESMWRDQAKYGKKVMDESAVRERLDKKLKGKEAAFQAWVTDNVMSIFGDPLVTVGRKKVPYTPRKRT